jgi:hypothetical protein
VSPGPSASLVETEETSENIKGDPGAPEPAAEGDIRMQYSSDWLCSPNIGAGTKIVCKNIDQYEYCLLVQNI